MGEFSFNLTLYTNVLDGADFVDEITPIATMWSRSIRLLGGYWQGSFRVVGEKSKLASYYDRWLGYHFEELSEGEKTWEGLVYEMVFNDGHTSRRRSLDDMYNYVYATYLTTDDPPTTGTTTPVSNGESIKRFGRREDFLSLDNTDQTPAEQRCNSDLQWNAYPWSRAVGGDFVNIKAEDRPVEPTLEVVVCGYVFTLNWRFTTTADDSTADLSDWINDIVDTDSEFCNPGSIEANTTQVQRTLDVPQRCWDQICKLVAMGDSGYDAYTARVGNGRYVEYEELDFTPYYYIQDGQIRRTIQGTKELNPWKVKPLCIRDLSYPTERVEEGSPYAQAGDFFPEEITCGMESGISWSAADFDETEIMATQEEYAQWLKRYADGGSGSGAGTGGERLNWKRRYGIEEGSPEWEEAIRLGRKKWEEKYRKKKAG